MPSNSSHLLRLVSVDRTVLVGQEAADFLGPPQSISVSDSTTSPDASVLAIMGGTVAAFQAENGEDVDLDEMHQSVTAEVSWTGRNNIRHK